MEQIYQEYLSYNFDSSEEYKDFKEKFPLQSNETLEEHRKKFYKSYINHDFDLNFKPTENHNHNFNNNQNNNHNNTQSHRNNHSLPPTLECIDYSLIFFSVLTSILKVKNGLYILMIYFLYRIYFAAGFIRFNFEYLKNIIHNNNFGFLVLCLVMRLTKTYRLLIILPMLIHLIVYLINEVNKYFSNEILQKFIRKQKIFIEFALYLEITNSVLNFFRLILLKKGFFFFLLYIQYLKFRFYASQEIGNLMTRMGNIIEDLKRSNNSFVSGAATFLQKVIQIIGKVGPFFGGGMNVAYVNGGVMFCNIF